jgi:hypothetical protein
LVDGLVSDQLSDRRRFRIMTLVDDFTKNWLALVADTLISGLRFTYDLDMVNAEETSVRASGEYVETAVGGETIRVFVSSLLPPFPSLDTRPFLALYDRTRGAIGQLDGVMIVLPIHAAIPLYVRPQRGPAFVSNRGNAIFAFRPVAVRERRNPSNADRRRPRGRGASKQPGEFRTSQNWIGSTRPGNALFVPPPNRLLECLGAFETFFPLR